MCHSGNNGKKRFVHFVGTCEHYGFNYIVHVSNKIIISWLFLTLFLNPEIEPTDMEGP